MHEMMVQTKYSEKHICYLPRDKKYIYLITFTSLVKADDKVPA